MPTLTEQCAADPDILAAQDAYNAADRALVDFNAAHPLTDYRKLPAEARKWRADKLAELARTFDAARDTLVGLLNDAANQRYGAPTARHEVTNPRLKPNWAE